MRDCKRGEQRERGQKGIIIVRGCVEGAVLFSKSKSRVGFSTFVLCTSTESLSLGLKSEVGKLGVAFVIAMEGVFLICEDS